MFFTELNRDDWEDFDEEEFFGKSRKRRRKRGEKPERRRSTRSRPPVVLIEMSQGETYCIKRKIRLIDPHETIYVRIPPHPIPRSWAKTIQPYSEPPAIVEGSVYKEVPEILNFDLRSLGGDYDCILMNPPWHLHHLVNENIPATDSFDLRRLNIDDRVIRRGFIFIWVEKEVISEVIKIMASWKFHYVENFVWVKRKVNNQFATQAYPYFRKSKRTLLILRKAGEIEIRHQRNPDVAFDFISHSDDNREVFPDVVYKTIETLLPSSGYQEITKRGRLLEL